MRAWTLAFSLGLIVCGFVPWIPSLAILFALLALALVCHRLHKLRLAGAFLLGCSWLLFYAHDSLQALWPSELEGVDVWTQGVVWNLPQQTERSLRFEFHIDKLCLEPALAACDFAALPSLDNKVLVNLYQPLTLEPGQRWQLQLRLQRPHGFANPGGFDYEAWLMQNRIRATGYVRENRGNVLLRHTSERRFTQLRHALVLKLATVEGLHYPQLIRALTLGDHYGISEAEWKLFSQTGTNHLIVISGMHVALIATVLYRLGWWLATRWTPVLLRWPAPQIAAAFALLGAWAYSGMAGLSLPVQRAFVMAAVLFAGRLLRRQTSSLDALCLALALILALDPLAPQNAGFWLSYCAVAVLLLTLRPAAGDVQLQTESDGAVRGKASEIWRNLALEWRTQWLVFVGLVPVLMLFFQQISPLSPLINMPAIPYVGLLIVPLALLAVLLLGVWPLAAELLLRLTDAFLHWYMRTLEWYVSVTPFDIVTLPALPMPATVLLCLLILGALFMTRLTLRIAALVLIPGVFLLWPRERIATGTIRVAVLDVGQGLAVVVSTREHHLLYDTGPYFSARFDAGSDVVVPYLRQRNIRKLDMVMVSHADSDHAGGLPGIAESFPDAHYLGSAPDSFPDTIDGAACAAGQRWRWDGVDFEVLHPDRAGYSSNDGSCVLLVSAGDHALLLPGDIEQSAERRLYNHSALKRTTVLLAPHHGSRSSSSAAFVASTRPQLVVYSSGYRNRFGHPHPQVRARYQAAGTAEYLSSVSGAIEFELSRQSFGAVRERRRDRLRFWSFPP
ncbi:MAG: hypothetical protein RLZZ227_591 [Pseudomonadota bacterium]|jgi:competence protein ComEC